MTSLIDLSDGPLAVVCLINALSLAVLAHTQTMRLARDEGGVWTIVLQVALTGASLGLATTAGMVLR